MFHPYDDLQKNREVAALFKSQFLCFSKTPLSVLTLSSSLSFTVLVLAIFMFQHIGSTINKRLSLWYVLALSSGSRPALPQSILSHVPSISVTHPAIPFIAGGITSSQKRILGEKQTSNRCLFCNLSLILESNDHNMALFI